MVDPDIRIINHAIVLLEDEHQMEREQARTALHHVARRLARIEDENEHLREALTLIAGPTPDRYPTALRNLARDALEGK